MRGRARALCCLALLSYLDVGFPHDLKLSDVGETQEANITQSDTLLNEKLTLVKQPEEIYFSEPNPVENTRTNNSQAPAEERNGNPEYENIFEDTEINNVQNTETISSSLLFNAADKKNADDSLAKQEVYSHVYNHHNKNNPVNIQSLSQSEPQATFTELISDSASYYPPGITGEYSPGHSVQTQTGQSLHKHINFDVATSPQIIASSKVPLDVGNIQLPIFQPQIQADGPVLNARSYAPGSAPANQVAVSKYPLDFKESSHSQRVLNDLEMKEVSKISQDVGNIKLPIFISQSPAKVPDHKHSSGSQFAAASKVPLEVGNMQLPLFMLRSQGNVPIHQPIIEDVPRNSGVRNLANPAASSNTNPAYDVLETETLTKILNSNLYPYNLDHTPVVTDSQSSNYNTQTQSSQEYKLSSNQIDALVQAIIEDKSSAVTQTLQSSTPDSRSFFKDRLYSELQGSYKDHSVNYETNLTKLAKTIRSKYYASVVASNDLIHLNDYAGAVNAIRCSREGEFYNLLTPTNQCLVCACVHQAEVLQPVCANCESCLRQDGPPVVPTEKTPVIAAATSCAPLPVGIAFEHPLNPCHICICYVTGHNDTQISCQEDPQCLMPPETTLQPSVPDSPTPIPTPLCHKFPEGVDFPHPTNNCKQCKCIRQNTSFGIQQYQMQCLKKQDCGAASTPGTPMSSTKPSSPGKITFSPTLRPPIRTLPSIKPTGPAVYDTTTSMTPIESFPVITDSDIPPSYTQPPYFIPISPQSIIKPTQRSPSLKPRPPLTDTPFSHVSQHVTQRPDRPKPFITIEPDRVRVPYGDSPTSLGPVGFPGAPSSPDPGPQESFTQYPVQSSTPELLLRDTPIPTPKTLEPIPWPPIAKPEDRGPLLGPPPHESCAPYPAGASFQHPWDECQLCRCAEYHSKGHVSIEVNCYTKPFCCVEVDAPLQLTSAASGQLQTLDKVCELRTLEADFVDETHCRVCVCRALGDFVLPVCRPAADASLQCAGQFATSISQEVIYIEPQCRHHPPSQPFVSGCSVCTCRIVFSYVVATCTLQPNCEVSQSVGSMSLQWQSAPAASSHAVAGATLGGAIHPWTSLSPADIKAIADYMAIHKQTELIQAPALKFESPAAPSVQYSYQKTLDKTYPNANFERSTKTINGQFIYSLPSYYKQLTKSGATDENYSPAPQTNYPSGYMGAQSDSYLTRSRSYTSKSGEEEADENVTSNELITLAPDENAYSLMRESPEPPPPQPLPAPIQNISSPEPAQLLSGSAPAGAVTRGDKEENQL